jgi:menaquinol-cytochrome c reductase iron-sulfur subunit
MIYGLWTAMGTLLSIPAIAYLFFPPKAKKAAQWVDAADLRQIPLNTPQELVFRRNKIDGWKITSEKSTAWVIKTADQQAVAFAPQCTHLGCAYHFDERNRNFVCPCHNSIFGIDGNVLSGPAPRPLDRYAIKIDGTRLQIGAVERHA